MSYLTDQDRILAQQLIQQANELAAQSRNIYAIASELIAKPIDMSLSCIEVTPGNSSELTLDSCGATLAGSSETISWVDPGAPSGRLYDLWINGVDQGTATTGNSIQVTGLPTNGSTITKQLYISDDGGASYTLGTECTCTAATLNLDKLTLSEIEAAALPWKCFTTQRHYEAEYLLQNPDTCFWEFDAANSCVRKLEDPAPANATVTLAPAPNGVDDSNALQAVIDAAPSGSTIQSPGGVYKVSSVDYLKPIRMKGFTFTPVGASQQEFGFVQSADVQFYDCILDGLGNNLAFGLRVETGSDRLQFIRSQIKNILYLGNLGWAQGAAISMRGNVDMHVACSRFENLTGNNATGQNGGIRVVMVNGRGNETVSRGVFVNNTVSEVQSTAQNEDADVLVIQNVNGNKVTSGNFFFAANQMTDAGGRAVKAQSGGIDAYSNFYHWATALGPVGTRRLKAFFDTQNSDDNNAFNNRILHNAGYTISGIFSILTNGAGADNIHYDCNHITWNFGGTGNAQDFVFFGRDSTSTSATGSEATNSSFDSNLVDGAGSVDGIFAWYEGWVAGPVSTSGNTISLSNTSINIDPA